MARIDVSTRIERPVGEVWDFFTDFSNSPHWTRSGSELRMTSAGPLAVGSTMESVGSLFGREVKSQALVATAIERNSAISFTSDIPILGRIVGGFKFESIGASTRLSRWSVMSPGGFRGALGALIVPLVRRTQRTEMANLKRLIEAREGSLSSAS